MHLDPPSAAQSVKCVWIGGCVSHYCFMCLNMQQLVSLFFIKFHSWKPTNTNTHNTSFNGTLLWKSAPENFSTRSLLSLLFCSVRWTQVSTVPSLETWHSDLQVKLLPLLSALFKTWLNMTAADKDRRCLCWNTADTRPHPNSITVCRLIKAFRSLQVFHAWKLWYVWGLRLSVWLHLREPGAKICKKVHIFKQHCQIFTCKNHHLCKLERHIYTRNVSTVWASCCWLSSCFQGEYWRLSDLGCVQPLGWFFSIKTSPGSPGLRSLNGWLIVSVGWKQISQLPAQCCTHADASTLCWTNVLMRK